MLLLVNLPIDSISLEAMESNVELRGDRSETAAIDSAGVDRSDDAAIHSAHELLNTHMDASLESSIRFS
jgi:hypothetical protein